MMNPILTTPCIYANYSSDNMHSICVGASVLVRVGEKGETGRLVVQMPPARKKEEFGKRKSVIESRGSMLSPASLLLCVHERK